MLSSTSVGVMFSQLKAFALSPSGERLESPTTIEIYVLDQNDNRPNFTKPMFEGSVPEFAAPGRVSLHFSRQLNSVNTNPQPGTFCSTLCLCLAICMFFRNFFFHFFSFHHITIVAAYNLNQRALWVLKALKSDMTMHYDEAKISVFTGQVRQWCVWKRRIKTTPWQTMLPWATLLSNRRAFHQTELTKTCLAWEKRQGKFISLRVWTER